MSPAEGLPAEIEPLARHLRAPEAEAVLANGPSELWLRSQDRHERLAEGLSPEDFDELVLWLGRKVGLRPGQVQASLPLPGGLRLDLLRAGAGAMDWVLHLTRPLPRAGDLSSFFQAPGPGEAALTALRRGLLLGRGLLVVGASGPARQQVLAAAIEGLPAGERVVLLHRGLVERPRRTHCLSLLVDPASGATRERLLDAAATLRPQRIACDELEGPELLPLLLGAGLGHAGPLAGLAAAGAAEALEELRVRAHALGLAGDPGGLVARRFPLLLQVALDSGGAPYVAAAFEQRAGEAGAAPSLRSLASPSPSQPQEPRRAVPLPREEPAEEEWETRPTPPEAFRSSLPPAPAQRNAVAEAPPETAVFRQGAARTAEISAPAQPPATRWGPPPMAAGGDIFEQMLASLPEAPSPSPVSASPGGSAPWARSSSDALVDPEEIDDSLLFGPDSFPDDELSADYDDGPDPSPDSPYVALRTRVTRRGDSDEG